MAAHGRKAVPHHGRDAFVAPFDFQIGGLGRALEFFEQPQMPGLQISDAIDQHQIFVDSPRAI